MNALLGAWLLWASHWIKVDIDGLGKGAPVSIRGTTVLTPLLQSSNLAFNKHHGSTLAKAESDLMVMICEGAG